MLTTIGALAATIVPARAGSARPSANRRQATNRRASVAARVTSTDSNIATWTDPTTWRNGTKNSPSQKIAGGLQGRVLNRAESHELGSRRSATQSWIDAIP